MQRDPLLYGIVGFIIGAVVIWFAATTAVNSNNTGMMRMMGMGQRANLMGSQVSEEKSERERMGMDSSMNDMMELMEGKTGEDFDKAFMESMTIHHQVAIEMAKKAKEITTRDELKKMADDIIYAQTNEINMMKEWQKMWGY